MEFPPDGEEWAIFPAEDFETAEVRDAGSLGMELMSQVRCNGRIQDHFRIVLGGNEILNVVVPFEKLVLTDRYNHLALAMQTWPKDIIIARNSTTSKWVDVPNLLAQRDATVQTTAGATVPQEEILAMLAEEQDTTKKSASIRWAVTVGADKKMWLELVSLPVSEATISGKPTLKR